MYAIIDVETTGGKRNEEALIDIAIFRYNGNKVVDEFSSLVNPEKPILLYVQKLTGINTNLLSSAPKFDTLAEHVATITSDAILIGHNISFDYYILKLEFNKLGISFKRNTIDTLELSRRLFPNETYYSLGKLCRSIGIPIKNRHTARGDAQATLELFQHLLKIEKKFLPQKNKSMNRHEYHDLSFSTDFMPSSFWRKT